MADRDVPSALNPAAARRVPQELAPRRGRPALRREPEACGLAVWLLKHGLRQPHGNVPRGSVEQSSAAVVAVRSGGREVSMVNDERVVDRKDDELENGWSVIRVPAALRERRMVLPQCEAGPCLALA
eukprot:CAMPEP_0179119700 /NCGR_PEP_ID=MMETSP0796-20121207/56364_1 /TAXON_ID=73915 /ORGANISM="Pyrodinium bahamense, Strain pbaha01" /LENGTH=126 /DNA_ID=CAMNT_0020818217 /DNA_START=76 /DNA_END=457 /DNA_ORIENTATION=-